MPSNASFELRKRPKQARSRNTVDVVLEAATRILEEGGLAAFNTNAVAERAGIGVASLYDYFPHKNAILIEFARREISRHRAAVMQAIAVACECGVPQPERSVIRTLMDASETRHAIRRIAAQVLAQAGLEHELDQSLQQISVLVAEKWPVLSPHKRPDLPPARLFVLTRAISGVLSAAVRENADFERKALEDALVALAEGVTRQQS
jgi:AcrR family transcriptional regulator